MPMPSAVKVSWSYLDDLSSAVQMPFWLLGQWPQRSSSPDTNEMGVSLFSLSADTMLVILDTNSSL